MSNYPAGVTGNEYEIAGADAEYTEYRADSCDNEECTAFEVEDVEVEVDIESYRYEEFYKWTCPVCKESKDVERNTENDHDY